MNNLLSTAINWYDLRGLNYTKIIFGGSAPALGDLTTLPTPGWPLHSSRVYTRSSTAAFRVVRSSCGPRTRTGQRSFAVNGPRTRNSLSAALRSPDLSLRSFKRQLKVLPVPSLRVSGARTTVRRHCDCTANLAPHMNIQTYLPTYTHNWIGRGYRSLFSCSPPPPPKSVPHILDQSYAPECCKWLQMACLFNVL